MEKEKSDKVLRAVAEIDQRLKRTNAIKIGYNDCWAMMMEYTRQWDPHWSPPDWAKGSFVNSSDFGRSLLRNSPSKNFPDAVKYLAFYHGAESIEVGISEATVGDFVIRRLPHGLCCSLVYINKDEFFVDENSLRIEKASLPLIDKTVICIGRKKQ